MDYTAPTGATDPNASYVGKTSSTLGSRVPPHAVEFPQREILNAELATGQTPSNNDLTQLIQAIATGIDLGTLGGTANAIADTLPGSVTIPTLRTGMTFYGIVGATNTGAVTLTLSGFTAAPGPKAVVRRDGATALVAGDLPAGVLVAFRYDGTSFRHVGKVPGETVADISNSGTAPQLNYFELTSAGTQNVGTTTITVVTDWNVSGSKTSDASYSAGSITIGAKTAGVWNFDGVYVPSQNSGAATTTQMYLYKNGVNAQNQTVTGTFCSVAGTVRVAAGDVLTVRVYQNSGFNQKNYWGSSVPPASFFNLYQFSG